MSHFYLLWLSSETITCLIPERPSTEAREEKAVPFSAEHFGEDMVHRRNSCFEVLEASSLVKSVFDSISLSCHLLLLLSLFGVVIITREVMDFCTFEDSNTIKHQ